MPLYEYQCDACGHRFETIQKFSDAPLDTCPKCGGAVHKLQSAPAFHLKGSGWYITDYARKDQGSAPGTPGGPGGPGGKDKPSGESSDKTERADRSDKAEKAEKAAKAEKSDSAAKEPAAAPAKSDTPSATSTPPSGSGPSAPTK